MIWQIWQRLKNFVFSLITYRSLSPDLRLRWQVKRVLRDRTALSRQEWFERFFQPLGVSAPIVTFAYTHLQRYSGLDVSRLLPTDRLEEDLYWTQVCWFDWEQTLYGDFWDQFQVDLSQIEEPDWFTLADLVIWLHESWMAARSTPSFVSDPSFVSECKEQPR